MNPMKILFFLLASFFFVGGQASQFSQIYYFGDSLSDLGNNTGAGSCDGGACTNPPRLTWAYFLGQDYQLDISRSKDGGTDYAYAGAVTSGDDGACAGDPNCSTAYQISHFIQQAGGQLDSNALYAIWAGANNILNTLAAPSAESIFTAATLAAKDVVQQVEQLHQAGAKNILVSNLPDLSRTPFIEMIGSDALSQAISILGIENFNNQLQAQLASKNYDVILIDAASIFDHLIENPSLYGFSNVTSLCDPSVDPSCAGYLFVYNVHPTVAAHEIIADYAYSVLTAPVFYAQLSRLSSQSILNNLSAVRQQMMPDNLAAPQKGIAFFGSLGIQPDSTFENNDLLIQNKNIAGTAGIQSFLSDTSSIGLAFTESFADTKQATQALGDFKINSSMLSVFLSYFKNNYYMNGILSAGLSRYRDINRYIRLGPYQTRASGSTSGSFLSGSFEGGWFPWQKETLQFGPYAALHISQVGIKGYLEQGAPSGATMYFNGQSENDLTGLLGLRMRWLKAYQQSLFLTNIKLAVANQWLDESRTIRFHVASLAESHAALPVLAPKGAYAQVGINIANIRKNGLILSGAYQFNSGAHHYQSHVITLGISVPMDKG